jgi:hypothetical protein
VGARSDRFSAALVAGLPDPVRRYFTHAIAEGAALDAGVRLEMRGRIKVGLWLPFTARQECDGRSFSWRAAVGVGRLRPLRVVDRYAGADASMDGTLFGRIGLFHAAGGDTRRSAAGRAALEAIWAPAALLPRRGVAWRAVSEREIVASWDVAPERPEVHIRIDSAGAVRSVSALRWGDAGRPAFGYIPCGCDVLAERRFGDLLVPSRVIVGWWYGTDRHAPFFTADIVALERMRDSAAAPGIRAGNGL